MLHFLEFCVWISVIMTIGGIILNIIFMGGVGIIAIIAVSFSWLGDQFKKGEN